MTGKEKGLLLRDISSRYMHGLLCSVQDHDGTYSIVGTYRNEGCGGGYAYVNVPPFGNIIIEYVKPYLRPLESMTEEEERELKTITYPHHDGYTNQDTPAYTGSLYVFHDEIDDLVDFYCLHHLDYRGLIPMGLALPASDGMYERESDRTC